jgi:uncharacterized protein YodC (DUF2158 family)
MFYKPNPIHMRKLLLLAAIFATIKTTAQDKLLDVLPTKDGKVYYQEIVPVDGATKDELYNRAKKAVVTMYKSAKDVIQLDDKESGSLIAKGNFSAKWQQGFGVSQEVFVPHTLSITVKDGKAKIELSDFGIKYFYQGTVEKTMEDFCSVQKNNRTKFLNQISPTIQGIIDDVKKALTEKSSNDF